MHVCGDTPSQAEQAHATPALLALAVSPVMATPRSPHAFEVTAPAGQLVSNCGSLPTQTLFLAMRSAFTNTRAILRELNMKLASLTHS